MKTEKERKAVKDIRNPNHPRKGSRIAVDPIRRLEDIKAIKCILSDQPRDLLLFTMGINNGLRTGDLLRLKVRDVSHLKEGEEKAILESKTNKINTLCINEAVYKCLKTYLNKSGLSDDDYLFISRKCNNAISIQTVNYLIKKWTKMINLNGNYGAHSLRKTFGYVQRKEYKVGYEILAKRYNHSNPAVTMRYVGVTDDEVSCILKNVI